jgi:hypothetical protein
LLVAYDFIPEPQYDRLRFKTFEPRNSVDQDMTSTAVLLDSPPDVDLHRKLTRYCIED